MRMRELNIQKLKDLGYDKCCCCGYDNYWGALEFHHLDSEEKEFGVASITHHNFEKILKEVEKCIMVCANCHRELHAGILEFNYKGEE